MLRANRPIMALFDAIKNLRIRQLALILKAGYDPNLMLNARGQNGLQFMVSYFGTTEAHYRLQVPINKSAYLSIAKLLLDSGLDPNAMDLLTDETVIFDAIRFNDKDMVALLLNYADLSLRNKNGETALMCTARFGSKQVTRMLLEHLRSLEMDGYFLRQRNRFGLTPLELARSENLEAAKMLTKHLIAYGHHAGAVLARSTSHHQLVEPAVSRFVAAAAGLRRGPSGAAAVAHRPTASQVDPLFSVDAVDCYSLASDFSDNETPLYGAGGCGPRAAGMAQASRAPRANYRPYFDPKAAEFSAYLLSSQQEKQMGGGGGEPSCRSAETRGQLMMTNSEDDEYGAGASAAAPGQLMRSRSCMLGPSSSSGAGGKQQAQMSVQKKSAGCAGGQM